MWIYVFDDVTRTHVILQLSYSRRWRNTSHDSIKDTSYQNQHSAPTVHRKTMNDYVTSILIISSQELLWSSKTQQKDVERIGTIRSDYTDWEHAEKEIHLPRCWSFSCGVRASTLELEDDDESSSDMEKEKRPRERLRRYTACTTTYFVTRNVVTSVAITVRAEPHKHWRKCCICKPRHVKVNDRGAQTTTHIRVTLSMLQDP